MRSTTDGVHFGPADGIRALAIALVFLDHVGLRSPERSAFVVALSLGSGGLGVAALFVLSGFLLSVPYLRAIIDRDRDFPSHTRYAEARFLRIYPLYAFAVLAIALFVVMFERHGIPLNAWDVVSHLTFLNDFQSSTVVSVSPVFWTMAVDVGFYILLPFAAWWAFRQTAKRSRPARIAFLVRALAAIILASIVYRVVAGAIFHPLDSADVVVSIRNTPGMAGLFAIGIIAQILIREGATRELLRRQSGAVVTVAIGGIALYFVLQLFMVLVEGIGSSGMLAVDDTIAAIGAASVLLFLVADSRRPLSQMLSSRMMVAAAGLSYAWYLFHATALDAVQKFGEIAFGRFGDAHPDVAYAGVVFATVVALLPFCYVVHIGIERPFLRKKNRILSGDGPKIVPTISTAEVSVSSR